MKTAQTTRNTKPTAPTAEPKRTRAAVLAALADCPAAATAAEVATAARIGRSTATKALAVLAAEGRVERHPGGRDGARRLRDRWALLGSPAVDGQPVRADSQAPAARRLGRGDLASMVLAHLQANPGEHLATSLVKAIGARSAGATANALVRVVERGLAVQTVETPKRYQVAGRS